MGKLYHIYCDESRQTQERFMALGGVITPECNVGSITATVQQLRSETGMHDEFKWSKIHQSKIESYRRFVDLFFDLKANNKIHFHSMLFDTTQIDHARYSGGDAEIGFYKLFYQLLLNSFGKQYAREGEDDRFIVKLDHRNTKYRLSDLKTILNNGMNSKFSIPTRPFRSVEAIDSASSALMQFTDVLLGAVGYQKNGFHLLPTARQNKVELAAHIAHRAGLRDLIQNTGWGQVRFKIWNFKFPNLPP